METFEQIDALDTQSSCSSSSIDSTKHSVKSAASDLRTDFKLGFSISPSSQPELAPYSTPREQNFDWPPIDQSTIGSQRSSLFVKVYMEGIPIGRKLNLLSHRSYDGLVEALGHMFMTVILCPYYQGLTCSGNFHVLTYEDREGDWMMVGDVPWERFLITVKRLKITRADKC